MEEYQLMTIKETASLLGISPKTIYNRLSATKGQKPFPIKPKRDGGSVRFVRKDVIAYIEER